MATPGHRHRPRQGPEDLHVHAQVACEAQKPGSGGPSTGWTSPGSPRNGSACLGHLRTHLRPNRQYPRLGGPSARTRMFGRGQRLGPARGVRAGAPRESPEMVAQRALGPGPNGHRMLSRPRADPCGASRRPLRTRRGTSGGYKDYPRPSAPATRPDRRLFSLGKFRFRGRSGATTVGGQVRSSLGESAREEQAGEPLIRWTRESSVLGWSRGRRIGRRPAASWTRSRW